MVADDLGSEKVFVDEETQELKLKEFKTANVEPAYLDILRWRMDQKYGRKGPKRKTPNGLGVHTSNHGSAVGSPYGSPIEDRGRSPHRFSNHTADTQSPRGVPAKSPLSQVSEETVRPMAERLAGEVNRRDADEKVEKLVEAPTPALVGDREAEKMPLSKDVGMGGDGMDGENDKENLKEPLVKGLGVEGLDGVESLRI